MGFTGRPRPRRLRGEALFLTFWVPLLHRGSIVLCSNLSLPPSQEDP